jgi:hypothetical protein
MLKADLMDAYLDDKGRLIVVYDKRVDPELSVKNLQSMKGFTVTHFKKVQ